jgi:hypothetical protein
VLARLPIRNVAQRGDALELLRALPDGCSPLAFIDPEFRAGLDYLGYGNEGKSRQRRRAGLPAMSEEFIDAVCRESARVLKRSGYLMRWADDFTLGEGLHLHVVYTKTERATAAKPLKLVNIIASAPGDLIVDPAAGSFTTMRAAHQLGRDFCGCDLVAPEQTWLEGL